MKKTIFILTLIAGFNAQAQNQNNTAQQEAFFYMQNGKLMVNDWGTVSELTHEIRLKNNTRITPEGYVINAIGAKTQLKEGTKISENGIIYEKEKKENMNPTNTK